jgi:hypothetical protein
MSGMGRAGLHSSYEASERHEGLVDVEKGAPKLVFAVSAFYNLVPPYHMSDRSAYP